MHVELASKDLHQFARNECIFYAVRLTTSLHYVSLYAYNYFSRYVMSAKMSMYMYVPCLHCGLHTGRSTGFYHLAHETVGIVVLLSIITTR